MSRLRGCAKGTETSDLFIVVVDGARRPFRILTSWNYCCSGNLWLGYWQVIMYFYKLTMCLVRLCRLCNTCDDRYPLSSCQYREFQNLLCSERCERGNFSIQVLQVLRVLSFSCHVRAILSEVGEFEKSFLMLVPTGFQPINNACCWQVGNLKERWKGEKRRNGKERK